MSFILGREGRAWKKRLSDGKFDYEVGIVRFLTVGAAEEQAFCGTLRDRWLMAPFVPMVTHTGDSLYLFYFKDSQDAVEFKLRFG